MTHEETERILSSLRRHYPVTKVYNTPESIEAYREILLQYNYGEVVAACKKYLGVGKYFPRPQEIVGNLKPLDAPVKDHTSRANARWVILADEALDAEIDAMGGVCALLHEYGGIAGETIRAHYPEERFCGACAKVAHYGKCPYGFMLHEEV